MLCDVLSSKRTFLAHLSSIELFWSLYVRRPLTFCTCDFFSRTTGQFSLNLAQQIIAWRGFKFVEMKGHALFQVEIIKNYWKHYLYQSISQIRCTLCGDTSGRVDWRLFKSWSPVVVSCCKFWVNWVIILF